MPSNQQVSSFIRSTFSSVWALELLCYLKRNPDRLHSHAEMVAGLRGSDLVVTRGVEALAAAGLVLAEADGSARYSPASEELDKLSTAAEKFYGKSPDLVRRMIVTSTNPGITAFADAFKLRKD